MRCSYCYNGKKFDRRMPVEVALRGVDLMFDTGLGLAAGHKLLFFGGEPLLEMDLVRRAVDHAKQRAKALDTGVELRIATNGTLLTGAALEFLLENDFFLAISIDGCEQAHDVSRRYEDGRPSHADIVANITAMIRGAPDVRMRGICVVDPQNVVWLAQSFNSLLAIGFRDISFNLNYEAVWNEESRQQLRTALHELGEAYMGCFRSGRRVAVNIIDTKIAGHVSGGFSPADRCDFGCREVTVAPSGNLYPCDRLVRQDDDESITIGHIDHGVDTVRRAALIKQKNRVLADCQECVFLSRCMHWCGCVNLAMTGSVGEVDPTLCWFEQQLIEQADHCASTLYQERNPLFLQRFYS